MEKQNKILFSQYYNIEEDPRTFDFLDIYLNADSLFFVDPAKIKYESTRESEYQYLFIRMQETIDNFFETVLKLYTDLGGDGDLNLEGNMEEFERVLGKSGETQSTHLGFGEIDSPGKGSSFEILKEAFDYAYAERLFELGVVEDMEELTLFTENFAYDRMSDFIISLIIPELAEFTLLQVKKYKIEEARHISPKPRPLGHAWDSELEQWVPFKEKALLDHVVKPVLLIPIRIISRTFLYDPDKYLSHSLWRRQEEYKGMDSDLNETNEDGTIKPPPHWRIKEVEIQAPGLSTKRYLIRRTLEDRGLKRTFRQRIGNIVANDAAVLTVEEIEEYRLADSHRNK